MRTILLALLAFALPVFAAPPPQAFDLDASATNRRFNLTTAQGTTPLFRANLRNANAAFSATGWTGTLYLSNTFEDSSVIAIPSTATGATYLDFQLDATDTATNGVFVANIIATDGTSTIEWQRGEVNIVPSPGTAGAGTITLSTPLSWSGYQYSGTGASGPYRAGTNVTFTTNADGSANINASVTGGSGDVTGITSGDSSITVTSGTGPVPDVSLPSTIPARNGSLLTALNASALASGTVATARLGGGTAGSGNFLRGDGTWAVISGFLPLTGGVLTGPIQVAAIEGADGDDLTLTAALGQGILLKAGSGAEASLDATGNFEIDGTFTGSGSGLSSLNASNLASGTIPDARFPATLPAASGVNLTALNASNLSSGTVADARLAAKYRQPVISWSYRDFTLQTTASVGWTGYEILAGSRRFGLDAISSAATTDQLATMRSDWTPVPATFAAFKETGAIRLTWVSSQAVVGETEIRGIRITGKSALTGTETIIYTDTTTRDIATSGTPVEVTINRSAFSSTTVPAYIAADVDFSCEDGDKAAVVLLEVLSE